MLKNFVHGRVAVFIDAANILYSQQTLGWRMDYTKLRDIFFYTGHVGKDDKQQAFLKKLSELGYQVRSKEVKRIRVGRNSYQWKGNLDVELTIDVVKYLEKFDTLILMSGDSDFAPLLDVAKQAGKRVIVMSTKGHVAYELIQRAKYINLKKLRVELEYKKSPQPKSGRGLTL